MIILTILKVECTISYPNEVRVYMVGIFYTIVGDECTILLTVKKVECTILLTVKKVEYTILIAEYTNKNNILNVRSVYNNKGWTHDHINYTKG